MDATGRLDDAALELVRAVAAVASATSVEAVASALTDASAQALGASIATLCLLEADGSIRTAGRHRAEARWPAAGAAYDPHRWDRIDPSVQLPITEAIRTDRRVAELGAAAAVAHWPDLAGEDMGDGQVCIAAVPLRSNDDRRCIGALGLMLPRPVLPTDSEWRYLEALAGTSAQAVDRISAGAAADEAAAKLEYLASVSDALAGSLDYEVTLQSVAQLAVPRLADWCSIDLLEEGRLRRVAVGHVDPAKVRLAWELWERFPTDLDAPTGAARVLRTGETELVEEVDESVLDEAGIDDELRRIVKELQVGSGLTVALTARGRTLGVLSLVYAESGRRYSPDDVRFAEDVARRAAMAIDNAQLHTETLQTALHLQRAVLPDTIADSALWRVAVHYRPAGRSEVGGDFFDALTLADGRLAVCVGDVMGRGVAAAASMAQVRAALRAYVVLDPRPEAVVTRLDSMFALLGMNQLVTLLYGVVDPVLGVGRWHAAGHLPPLVVSEKGEVGRVALTPAPPLGAGAHERLATEVPFGPTTTMLLYSDGLVERRGEDIDEGLARLEAAAARLAGRASDASLAGLADELRQAGHDDDVTVLAFRQLQPTPVVVPPAARR